MTRKATEAERTRTCAHCGDSFMVAKPSQKTRYCGHKCAFAVTGHKARAAANTTEARAKNAAALRRRGRGGGYIKRGGRHEHRVIAEEKLGRALRPDEIARHADRRKDNNAPSNIDVVNASEHARRCFAGPRTPKAVCKNGHALTADNVTGPRRRCLTCARTYGREWKRARSLSQQEHAK